eukprot:gene15042-16595_t
MAMSIHYDILNTQADLRERNYSNVSREHARDSPRVSEHHRHLRHCCCCADPRHRSKASLTNKPRVIINISGKRYETYERTFTSKNNCLLAQPKARKNYFDVEKGEYFFDRNAKVFEALLTYLQTGILSKPEAVPDKVYLDDLRFFGFHDEALDFYKSLLISVESNCLRDLPKNPYMRKVWETMEYPNTSRLAKIISVFSTFVITLSIVIFCVETLPQFNDRKSESAKFARSIFMWIESACVAWFTLEYLARLASTPNKIRFLYQPLNIIDLAAIVPFYVILTLNKTSSSLTSLAILRVLRLARVFRIFKLSRYSKALQLLMQTILASMKELVLLLFLLIVITILFSSAFYYFETDGKSNSDFKSIPHTFWLSIVTITTVGYGDMVPCTIGGRLVGAVLAVTGVLVVALPIPIIVNNFSRIYTRVMKDASFLDELAFVQDEHGELLVQDMVTSL